MIEKVQANILSRKLIVNDDTILIAVSGGVDSMVLVDILLKSNHHIGCAHINHQLRGSESDQDAKFVRQYCIDRNIRYHHVTIPDDFFGTGNMHQQAREFRYQWLQNIAADHGYSKISTAHHQDDVLETFMINAMRGAGLEGLKSIQAIQQNIIRPLLSCSKKEILSYATENHVGFREDSSNASDKYLRNKIRQHLMPVLDTIDERNHKGLSKTIDNVNKDLVLLDGLIENYTKENVVISQTSVEINLEQIKNLAFGATMIYHLIKKYGFNEDQSERIYATNTNEAKLYRSTTHQAIVSRNVLTINLLGDKPDLQLPIQISVPTLINLQGIHYKFELLESTEGLVFEKDTLYLDADKVGSVLTLRHWHHGDKMQPLGMNGSSQSIQDIFTNQKMNETEKSSAILAESDSNIVAILCWKTSEKYKIDESTRNLIVVKKKTNM
jgi:tRNA(Ile)-lysidine synthase